MSTTFISYFDRYSEFDHHPRRSIRDEFNRLAKSLKWDRAESARQRANCYNDELEGHFALLGITESWNVSSTSVMSLVLSLAALSLSASG